MIDRLIPLKLQLFAIAFSLFLVIAIVALIRKGKLKEGYCILWFGIGLTLLVISIWTDLLSVISHLVGVYYEPATLFTVLLLGAVLLMMHFTIILSGFDRKNKALAQMIGILMWEINKLKKSQEQQNRETQEKEGITELQ